jgi:hypothetical protein
MLESIIWLLLFLTPLIAQPTGNHDLVKRDSAVALEIYMAGNGFITQEDLQQYFHISTTFPADSKAEKISLPQSSNKDFNVGFGSGDTLDAGTGLNIEAQQITTIPLSANEKGPIVFHFEGKGGPVDFDVSTYISLRR